MTGFEQLQRVCGRVLMRDIWAVWRCRRTSKCGWRVVIDQDVERPCVCPECGAGAVSAGSIPAGDGTMYIWDEKAGVR